MRITGRITGGMTIAVVLLTNRTWPGRQSQLIRQVRHAFHEAIREALKAL